MIMMALDLQKEMLDSLAASRPHDLQFAADLNKIYEEVEKEETEENESLRLAAERRVMRVVQEHGERIGHGDLLTSMGLNKKIPAESKRFLAKNWAKVRAKLKFCDVVVFFVI